MIEAYLLHLLVLIGIYIILAISLNFAMGVTGLLNIGHVAFYAIGAYTSALLTTGLGVPMWAGLIAGGLLAALSGILLSLPTRKLKGDYLALATLGFVIIVEAVLKNWASLTNGPMGVPGIPKPEIFGITLSSTLSYLVLVLIFVGITYVFLKHLTDSPYGRVLKAIRDDELVAKALGKNTPRFKMSALAISAFFAGIAGSLFAHYISFIDPTGFSVMESVLIISMIIVGGLGSIEGSILGTVIILLLPEPLRFLPLPSYAIGALRQILYASLLMLLLVIKPRGLLGDFRRKKKC